MNPPHSRSPTRLLGGLLLVLLPACWNTQLANDRSFAPLDRPVSTNGAAADQRGTGGVPVLPATSAETDDFQLTVAPGPLALAIRKNAPRQPMVDERAVLRFDLPVGHAKAPTGLAEIAAAVLTRAADARNHRPSMRGALRALGAHLDAAVGPEWTSLTVTVPAASWRDALQLVAERLADLPNSAEQFRELQTDHIRQLLADWQERPLLAQVAQWIRDGTRERNAILAELEERSLADVMLFQRRHYRPSGVVIGLWIPGVAAVSDALRDDVRSALSGWRPQPVPPAPAETATTPAALPDGRPSGVQWIESDDDPTTIALLIPLGPGDPATRVLSHCFSFDGVGGRLGAAVRQRLGGGEPAFQVSEIGSFLHRYRVMTTRLPAEKVRDLFAAASQAWDSLASDPPTGRELARAIDRTRLEFQARQSDPAAWFEAVGLRLMHERPGGPAQDLEALAELARGEAAAWREAGEQLGKTKLAMVVHGGTVPRRDRAQVAIVPGSVPTWHRPTGIDEESAVQRARPHLEDAVSAAGGHRLRFLRGYRASELWDDGKGSSVEVSTRFERPDELRRTMTTLDTVIRIEVGPGEDRGVESIGDEERALTTTECRNHLDEASRHPLLLLSEWAREESSYRYLGLRKRGGREVVLLERADPAQDRLRITIDIDSGLLRTVETIQHRAGIGSLHMSESYEDYRMQDGLRIPFHKTTVVDRETAGVASSYREFAVLP